MAEVVGASGRAVGVDREADAVATARALLDEAGHSDVEVCRAEAWDTGLEPGAFDVVCLRHVLAHNTADEMTRILEHVRVLLRPGGCCYVAESDLTANRIDPPIADLVDLTDRYVTYLRSVGRNPATGPMMGSILLAAGFELVGRDAQYVMPPPGRSVRPPSWAAREAMVEAGIATADDVERWDACVHGPHRRRGQSLLRRKSSRHRQNAAALTTATIPPNILEVLTGGTRQRRSV